VRASIDGLRHEAARVARDAEQLARGADETERDLKDGNWTELARFGFVTYDEAAMMAAAPVRNRRRSKRGSRR
jgi:hypothetical protein